MEQKEESITGGLKPLLASNYKVVFNEDAGIPDGAIYHMEVYNEADKIVVEGRMLCTEEFIFSPADLIKITQVDILVLNKWDGDVVGGWGFPVESILMDFEIGYDLSGALDIKLTFTGDIRKVYTKYKNVYKTS